MVGAEEFLFLFKDAIKECIRRTICKKKEYGFIFWFNPPKRSRIYKGTADKVAMPIEGEGEFHTHIVGGLHRPSYTDILDPLEDYPRKKYVCVAVWDEGGYCTLCI